MENGDHDAPGSGWTNGDLPSSMYPYSRDGRVSLYSSQRRWINSTSSWTRIGKGTTEMDKRHSTSMSGVAVEEDPEEQGRTMRSLIAQLCERFYNFGWATGTGGGVSIRIGNGTDASPFRVFVAPSGIQKEDMVGDDVFELDMDMQVVVPPKTPNLRQSACTPLWYVVYKNRPSARCVIHTHSMHAQMATLLDPTEQTKVLTITHLEMLKGVGNHAYDDVLEIPIIDNRPSEDLLAEQLESVIQQYPKCNAVLVRRHGVYVWGDSWEQAKTQCESFDYLFESAVKMKTVLGISPANMPTGGTYRETDGAIATNKRLATDAAGEHSKRARTEPAFNAASDKDNAADLKSNTVPIVPRDGKVVLLDIEGCTTAISFVKDCLFPYALAHLEEFLTTLTDDELAMTWKELCGDISKLPDDHVVKVELKVLLNRDVATGEESRAVITSAVRSMVGNDVKATGLKQLQGQMWKFGFESGEIKGHVYADFVPFLSWCQSQSVEVHIYSSGSIQAQKLLFGNSTEGDLLPYLGRHFDTTSGKKAESNSYLVIAKALEKDPQDVIFVSDSEAELVAAQEAGIGRAIMSIRPGNAPLTDSVGKSFPAVYSLLQLCGQ